jgi:NAD-dependent dihydropyrimidine dehydrogenase PreA subunit
MVQIDLEKCTGCKTCEVVCQVGAIKVVKRKAQADDKCVNCAACVKVCPENALAKSEVPAADTIICDACPIACEIKKGHTGACLRYINDGGRLVRNIPLVFYSEVADIVPKECHPAIEKPLITAIGAGTTSPDNRPAPYIVQSKVDGLDVVTCVTECPLTVNGIKVKVDTDLPIGEEGADVTYRKHRVGMVTTEEYGATMLALGGLHTTSGKNGMFSVKVVTDIANRKRIPLSVKGGAKIEIQVSQPPVINGVIPGKMRVGCGSATAGLFSTFFRKAADEVIVLDHQITSLFSAHAAGRDLKASPSGMVLRYRESTPGRYFGEKGDGLGGTNIINPLDVIDMKRSNVRPGTTLLVTETTGERFAFFRFENGRFVEIDPTAEVLETINEIASSCEPSKVSAMLIGGAGGSARAGIAKRPLKLNEAIRERKAKLTIGGAPVFIMPGGGITFVVDVEEVKSPFFYWVPTPAVVAPIEYTMSLKDYIAIGGHAKAIRPLDEVIEQMKKRKAGKT